MAGVSCRLVNTRQVLTAHLPLVIYILREACRRFDTEKSLQIRLSALKIKMNGVIARRFFSVHFSGWFTSTHVAHILNNVIEQFFSLQFHLVFLINVFFENYKKKDTPPCLFRRFNEPNLPHLCLYWH